MAILNVARATDPLILNEPGCKKMCTGQLPNLSTQKGLELRQYLDTGLFNKIPIVMFKGWCFYCIVLKNYTIKTYPGEQGCLI